MHQTLPFATPDFPGIGGVIKRRAEDFFVQEVPLYEPTGEGEHVMCEIQKLGISTPQAVARIARTFNLDRGDIGTAGLKDAHALTRQHMTVRCVTEEQLMTTPIEDVQVLWAARHKNKLKPGHSAGNRFAVKVRDVNAGDVVKLRPVVDRLVAGGVPNYFGPQRFGNRGDNHLVGLALVRGDEQAALKHLLGNPIDTLDQPDEHEARAAFDAGDLARAAELFPERARTETKLLGILLRGGTPRKAIKALGQGTIRFLVAAGQSGIFNELIARRVTALSTLLDGDVAMKPNGGCFIVQDLAAEQPRADAFEISPTGCLFGTKLLRPERAALELEEAVLASHGITQMRFEKGYDQPPGERRPLRVKASDASLAAGVDELGDYITLAFTLPPGAFATSFVRELTKNDAVAERERRPAGDQSADDTPDDASEPA
ncbi:MAG: tRNA pseudouridine(13) synthase TruD [Phycisphaerae bacterium]